MFFTSYFIDVDTFYLFLNWFSTRVSDDRKYVCGRRLYACINTRTFKTQKWQKSPGAYFQKNWVGVCSTLPETLPLFQTKLCDYSYPISDLIKNLIPYSRPEALEPGALPERVTSCYDTCTVVGVNIRLMVSSPNDEEVANSPNKHTQLLERTNHTLFQTRTAKLLRSHIK